MIKKNKNSRDTIFTRAFLVYLISLLLGFAIMGKAIYIQTAEKESLLQKAEKQTYKLVHIPPLRGTIFSEDKKFLAISIPIFDISMDFKVASDTLFNNNVGALASELSNLFGDKSTQEYKRILLKQRRKRRGYYTIKRKITYAQLKKVKTFPIFKQGRFRGGLIVERQSTRKRPYGALAERSIGYINQEGKGVGIEYAYNNTLKGIEGKKMMQRLASGGWKPMYDDNDIEPINGKDIITGIDIELQDVAENSLSHYLKKFDADWGTAILMEVETGYIKAIANLERHLNKKKDTVYYESYNHAVGTAVEPGSTFKLASFLAILEKTKLNLDDTIDIGRGVFYVYGTKISDPHRIRDGKITIREVFELSSNVGTSKLVNQYYKGEIDKYINKLYDFGLNKKLDLDIIGEGSPYIKNPKDKSWSGVSSYFMSYGHELLLTPLQILAFYNAIANDGKMVKPLFVKSIEVSGVPVKTFEPKVLIEQIATAENIKLAQGLLEGVTQRGTARRLKNAPFKAAGKTGTAQIAGGGKYDKVNYNASFVGYFPADNPKYSCLVLVNRPKKGGTDGSVIAVPVFKDIALKVYAMQPQLNHKTNQVASSSKPPTFYAGDYEEIKEIMNYSAYPLDTVSEPTEWTVILPEKEKAKLAARKISNKTIPNVKNMGARDAVYILRNLGLEVSLKGRGHVNQQSLAAGSIFKPGNKIELTLR